MLAAALAFAGCGPPASTPVPPAPSTTVKVTVAPNTYYRDYTGVRRPSLAAVSAGDTFDGTTIAVYATMSGPIVDGSTNFYIWGFNRGGATNAPFPDEPNVIFDAVVVATVTPSGGLSATVTAPLGTTPKPLPAPTLINPSTILVSFPASVLPPTGGGSAAAMRWNLWPRNGLGGTAAAQIASFIPDNDMIQL